MRIVNDDVELYAELAGEGECVVLLHGFPLSHRIWDRCVRALSSRYRVLAPDIRGMGESHVGAGPYLMEQLAGDLAAMLESLAIERVTLIGHSLGGFVALAYARMYAERVARLGLVGSRLAADSSEQAVFRRALSDRIEVANSGAEAVEAFLPRLLPAHRLADSDLVARIRAIGAESSAAGLAAVLRGMALRDSAFDIAADLAMPVAVMVGAEDPAVSLAEMEACVAAFPDATLTVLPGSGHLPMLEAPEAFEKAIEALLAR